jgi:hypothetical protein
MPFTTRDQMVFRDPGAQVTSNWRACRLCVSKVGRSSITAERVLGERPQPHLAAHAVRAAPNFATQIRALTTAAR